MEITLTNQFLQATISSCGAQLLSLKDLSFGKGASGAEASGVEYIWNGNPSVWKFRAPILFPIVGRLKDGYFLWQGKEYHLPNHGFSRDLEHSVVEEKKDRVVWRLQDTPYTRELFPWPFVLETEYQLVDSTLVFRTTVTNPGQQELAFSLGSHTGLAYPWKGFRKEDYYLQFQLADQQNEVPRMVASSEGGFVLGTWRGEANAADTGFQLETVAYPNIQEGKITLQDGLFGDGHILTGVTSQWVALVEGTTGRQVRVNTAGFPYVVLWQSASPTEPFVCIEPWFGLPDWDGTSHEWERKPGLVRLEPGNSFSCHQSLEIVL